MAGFSNGLAAERERINAAARPAAQAAAQVIYEAARINAPVGEKEHYFYGRGKQKYGPFKPGSLRDAIYQVYSQKNSSETKATYHVSVNRKEAPYAAMVEFGTSRAAAHSYLGKAIVEQRAAAAQAMRVTFAGLVTQ